MADEHHTIAYFVLLFSSAGVLHHSKKVPYYAFFAHDSGKRCKEAPPHMLLAMGVTEALCIFLGVYPQPLYAILPYEVGDYTAYDVTHVVTQLQLLMWAILAFAVLNWFKLYPHELRSTILSTDWIYRRLIPAVGLPILRAIVAAWNGMLGAIRTAAVPCSRRPTATTVAPVSWPAPGPRAAWPCGSPSCWRRC